MLLKTAYMILPWPSFLWSVIRVRRHSQRPTILFLMRPAASLISIFKKITLNRHQTVIQNCLSRENEIISNRPHHVALYCLSCEEGIFEIISGSRNYRSKLFEPRGVLFKVQQGSLRLEGDFLKIISNRHQTVIQNCWSRENEIISNRHPSCRAILSEQPKRLFWNHFGKQGLSLKTVRTARCSVYGTTRLMGNNRWEKQKPEKRTSCKQTRMPSQWTISKVSFLSD